jgi:indole-3-glycerol phosphate synthase
MNKLAEINATKLEEIKRLEPHAAELRKAALLRNDFRPFRSGLQLGDQVALIAEVKKASPSAGVIAADFNPLSQAREYARGGAHALSVLTDEKYFQGHLTYLRQIREQVELPLLRKDFILHELQIYESVIAGADCILLIVASLDDVQLRKLYDVAKSCQLDILVEVHDLPEMERALELGADMIGINNRNARRGNPQRHRRHQRKRHQNRRRRAPCPSRRHQRHPRRRNPHARQKCAREDAGTPPEGGYLILHKKSVILSKPSLSWRGRRTSH